MARTATYTPKIPMLVVREIISDGTQEIYFLRADDWTLHEFQLWLFGLVRVYGTDNGVSVETLKHGPQRNEILAYYPNGIPDNWDMRDERWADPDGLPGKSDEGDD